MGYENIKSIALDKMLNGEKFYKKSFKNNESQKTVKFLNSDHKTFVVAYAKINAKINSLEISKNLLDLEDKKQNKDKSISR